jgi:hypothetical protein
MISELRPQFHELDEIQIALSPGNQNPRGVATVAAILSYVGRPIRVWNQQRWELRTGWTDRDRVLFPSPLGNRRVYQCDAPDLELFPTAFGARSVQFRAGLELSLLNWALAGLSRLRSAGLLGNLPRYARLLARASKLLMPFGSRWGTLGVWVRGKDHTGNALQREIALVTDSDGPAIPIAPAVLLAKRLLDRGPPAIGAAPCLGFFSLKELGNFLRGHHAWLVHGTAGAWDKLPFGIGS